MKKLIALILALTMIMCIAGCSTSEEETTAASTETNVEADTSAAETTAPAEEVNEVWNIYGIYKSDGAYFVNESWALEEALIEIAEPAGIEVAWKYLSCDMDPEKCMTLVENAIADKADAIVICVPDQTMSISIVERCDEAGVPVIAVDDGLIDETGAKIAPWFGIDAYNIGYAAGEWLANYAKDNNLLEDESVGLMYSTMSTVSSCVPRTEGAEDAWADVLGEGVMADRTFYADFETTLESAYNAASAVITGNPQIKTWLVMTPSENGALGCGSAIEEAGLVETSCVVALGADEVANQWDQGNYEVIREAAYFSGMVVGRECGKALGEYLLNGTELPDEYATPAVMIDRSNYQDVVIRIPE